MKHLHVVGEFAFIIGIVLAVVVGFFSDFLNGAAMSSTLILLGFVIGLLSITEKESDRFLISSIALLIAGGAILQILPFLGEVVDSIFTNVVTLVAPAAIVVAIKSLYSTATNNSGFLVHIVKRDGTLQLFMKKKIVRSCTAAGCSNDQASRVADDVAKRVKSGTTSRDIAYMVQHSLARVDKRAARSYGSKMRKKK